MIARIGRGTMNLTETPRAPSSGSTARHVRRPRRRSSGRTGLLAGALVGVFAVMSGLLSLIGEHEARGREVLAMEWFGALDAPFKEALVFDGAGHRSHFDRPELFADFMQRVVLELGRAGER